MGWSLITLLWTAPASGDPVAVEWDTIATHPNLYDDPGAVDRESVGLIVSNHGEMGHAGLGGANMDFVASGFECGTRPEDAVYLYSGSPYVILADDSYGANALLTCSYGQIDDTRPYSWVPTGEPGSIGGGFTPCPYRPGPITLGKFLSRNGAIAMERTYHPPLYSDGARNFIIVETKLYSGDGQPHNHLTAGSVMDWNIPSDSANMNTSGDTWDGWGGFVYMQGTDTAMSEACQPNVGRFAAEVFGGVATVAEFAAFGRCANGSEYWSCWSGSQKLLRDTNLARDGVTVIDPPQPDARAWWDDIGANPELHSNTTAEDQAIWLTYIYNYYLGAQDTLWFWSVLAAVPDGTVHDLQSVVSEAKVWCTEVIRECQADCQFCRTGNANGMGGDEPTIGDISTLIDAKFITGTCDGIIQCLEEADVNQSGGSGPTCDDITISDIAMLIDYLFITGPSLGLPLCNH
ncbi:MAG: hypothetical protein J7J98_05910 [candidate division Zixibacteria bacterium]|nr:hypothetical protein [candidate division Zixibacteria bacterium]